MLSTSILATSGQDGRYHVGTNPPNPQESRNFLRPLKVLLVSPVRSLDPPSGDVSYTEALLECPPEGVDYVTYDQAIEDGTLVEYGTRGSLVGRSRVRKLDQWVTSLSLVPLRKVESLLRGSGLAYRERIRVFWVRQGAFDVVHAHVFNVRFVGRNPPPLVVSSAGPLSWPYRDAWGWSTWRVRVADAVDLLAGAAWDATMCAVRRGRADLVIALTQYLADWTISRGVPARRVVLIRNYLGGLTPDTAPRTIPTSGITLGFVARDFKAKGGPAVLDAYRMLRDRYPQIRLLVAGSEDSISTDLEGVTWLGEIPRQRLLNEVYASIDLFIYPSRYDGSPYVLMEALGQGIPLVVSNYRALPEFVREGAGRVLKDDSPESIVEAVESLLDPSMYEQASTRALGLYHDNFSPVSQTPRLRIAYEAALKFRGESSTHG